MNTRTTHCTDAINWSRLSSIDYSFWNNRLMQSKAALFQFPFWNIAINYFGITPLYLKCIKDNKVIGFACILKIGFGVFKIGLIMRGPVFFTQDKEIIETMLFKLYEWTKRYGFFLLRFSHSNTHLVKIFTKLNGAVSSDAFPIYKDLGEELIIHKKSSHDEIWASFQNIARRKITKASAVGYQLTIGETKEDFMRVWPLLQKLSKKKSFSLRPLKNYLKLINAAETLQTARIYTASLGGVPINTILIITDGSTAMYMSGALDTELLEDNESPSPLLHWFAMKNEFDCHGITQYNLGTRSGKVYTFKRQFHPVPKKIESVSVIINPLIFKFYDNLVLKNHKKIKTFLKKILS